MKNSLIAAALLAATVAPGAAVAQEAAVTQALVVGAKVYGPQGNEVGTIEKMAGGNAVVFTGTQRATLPAAAFGKNEKGLLIGMTKAQLESAVAAASAKASANIDAALVPSAEIRTKDGVLVGAIEKIEGDNVWVDLADGDAITLKKEHLTTSPQGLALFMTDAEFKAAVAAAAGASSAPADSAPTSEAAAETDGDA